MKKSYRGGSGPPRGLSPPPGRGESNTRLSSLAPIGGEGGPPDGGPGEGVIGEHSEFFHTFRGDWRSALDL